MRKLISGMVVAFSVMIGAEGANADYPFSQIYTLGYGGAGQIRFGRVVYNQARRVGGAHGRVCQYVIDEARGVAVSYSCGNDFAASGTPYVVPIGIAGTQYWGGGYMTVQDTLVSR